MNLQNCLSWPTKWKDFFKQISQWSPRKNCIVRSDPIYLLRLIMIVQGGRLQGLARGQARNPFFAKNGQARIGQATLFW